jgi:predicted dehydrogenase
MELRSFLQSITEGGESAASGKDGVRAVEIVEAAARAVETGKPQTITYRTLR